MYYHRHWRKKCNWVLAVSFRLFWAWYSYESTQCPPYWPEICSLSMTVYIYLSFITSNECCVKQRELLAAGLPVISSINPWGAAEDLHFYTRAAAYGWLTPLSPTAEAQARTRFTLLINPSKRNDKVCSYKQTSEDFIETSFLFCLCPSLPDVHSTARLKYDSQM